MTEDIKKSIRREIINNTVNGLPMQFISHVAHTHENTSVEYHYHNYIELLYILDGEHKAWVDGTLYTVSEGDIILINSSYVHGFEYYEGSYLCLRFDPEVIYNSHKNAVGMKYILPFILNGSKHNAIFRKNNLENSNVPELLFRIHKEYNEKHFGYEYASQIMINEIYLWFLRYWNNRKINMDFENEVTSGTAKWLNKVFTYVAENYSLSITTLEVANLCNMSYSYFSRSFKKIMHKSFSEYLNYVRITEAEKLLLTTDMNITEIAVSVGFSTSSYFIQQFKNFKSSSPKQYKIRFEA